MRADFGPSSWTRLTPVLAGLTIAATLFLLTSLGGAMAIGAPVLIPLHLWFSRQVAWPFWLFLALLSAAEAGFVYTYVITGEDDYWYVLLPFVVVIFIATKPRRKEASR